MRKHLKRMALRWRRRQWIANWRVFAGGRYKDGWRAVRVETEWWRGKLEGRESKALVRASGSKIAGGVRGDNWSEGRLRCSWPGFRLHWKRGGPVTNGKFKVRALEKRKGYGPRLTFLFRLTNEERIQRVGHPRKENPRPTLPNRGRGTLRVVVMVF